MDMSYENWKQGLDPIILDQWPAQELIHIDYDWWEENRDAWISKWMAAGGRIFEGRLVALKNDPVWRKISCKGKPYGPYDEQGMTDCEDVDRDEATRLNLIHLREVLDPAAFEQDSPASLVKPCD